MKVVFVNWRDLEHPRAGGAEHYADQLLTELSKRGHKCTWLSSGVKGQPDTVVGIAYTVVRFGNQFTCRIGAARWLREHEGDFDIVIDSINTLPFLSRFVTRKPLVALFYQLAREVWLYEAPWPLSILGFLLEPWLLRVYRNTTIAAISRSTAESLKSVGLQGTAHVITMPLQPPQEFGSPTPGLVGYVGRVTPSKRIGHLVDAIGILRDAKLDAKLVVVGGGSPRDMDALNKRIALRNLRDHVEVTGRLPALQRDEIVSKLTVNVLPSVREGWGMVVSEAARFGVPSVGYAIPGLVDSIVDGKTGVLAREQTPHRLADAIATIIQDRSRRNTMGAAARELLAAHTIEAFGTSFEKVLEQVVSSHRKT